jgi:hypothetical protein
LNKHTFFNDTATTEIYTRSDTLSLHDALPISIQFINSDGSLATAYYWNYPSATPADNYVGWFDAESNPLNDLSVAPGDAFILSSVGSTTLLSSGEVKQSTTVRTVPAGVSLAGNTVPRAVTLGEVTIPSVGVDEEFTGSIQFIEPDGTLATAYYWNYPSATPADNYVGWFDAESNPLNGRILQPGDSFIVSSVSSAEINFPAPL